MQPKKIKIYAKNGTAIEVPESQVSGWLEKGWSKKAPKKNEDEGVGDGK